MTLEVEVQTSHLPRRSGIYQIKNTETGKVYVGSAMDVQKRLHLHRAELRENRHRNQKLQHAWNKYGAESFVVSVLEDVPDHLDLVKREQVWIDAFDAIHSGYNIAPRAGSQLGFKYGEASLELASRVRAKPIQGFRTPEGYPVTILNLGLFCRANGLTTNTMRLLVSGKATSHKGWTHVNGKQRERNWISTYEGFIDPSGHEVGPITNLEQFCRDHGLIPSNMNKVYRGLVTSHRGWTHVRHAGNVNGPTRAKTYPGQFIDPTGERHSVTNLTAFAEQRGLNQAALQALFSGKRRVHKGWRYEA